MVLYETTLSVFEVPARLSPVAMRSFTESVIGVLTTASTYEQTDQEGHMIGFVALQGTNQAEHALGADKDDYYRE